MEGYIYHQTYDDSHLFPRDGELLESKVDRINRPEVSLRIGNKEISGGLFKIMKIELEQLN